MRIALIGKICSGKDRVASFFDKSRFSIIDGDRISHDVLDERKDDIRKAFGNVFSEDGKVDRKRLSAIVFSDKRELEKLNRITHPYIKKKCLEEAERIEKSGKVAILNGALSESMGLMDTMDRVILVTCPYDIRSKRAKERSGMDEEEFKRRDDSQKDVGSTLRDLGIQYDVIDNSSSLDELYRQVENYCDRLSKEVSNG